MIEIAQIKMKSCKICVPYALLNRKRQMWALSQTPYVYLHVHNYSFTK